MTKDWNPKADEKKTVKQTQAKISEAEKDTMNNLNNTMASAQGVMPPNGARGTQTNPLPNSITAQANAKPGDWIQTNRGPVMLRQSNIVWAKNKLNSKAPQNTQSPAPQWEATDPAQLERTLWDIQQRANNTALSPEEQQQAQSQYAQAYAEYTRVKDKANKKTELDNVYNEYIAAKKKYESLYEEYNKKYNG